MTLRRMDLATYRDLHDFIDVAAEKPEQRCLNVRVKFSKDELTEQNILKVVNKITT